ncbi:MAG: glycosyltransferase family 39 protein [Thaumarchaeota archaeon]|nr:glycosyltransferase family 39 protein [Nitrososphaerota archaeon]
MLILSGATHIWNAAGFPAIFFDEGVYMRRAMNVLDGFGPQESFYHDHPFFGQIFLASTLGLIGFPNSLHPLATTGSIATLYLAPRIIMGILAIVDTFLIYKIAESLYGRKVALISSMLFAVMPITWLVREILLDSILLPFLLMSIFLSLHSKDSNHKNLMVLLSGICLGLAIFTKIPASAIIPLVAGLIYFNNGKKLKLVGLLLVPVILISLIWPLQSVESGQFDLWVKDVLGQAERHSYGLPYISYLFLKMDPVLFVLGITGIAFSIARRDYFILMWFVPFMIFLLAIGYNQYFYWIPVLPVFCISTSLFIVKVLEKTKKENLRRNLAVVVFSIGVFGLASTLLIINTNMTSSQFQTISFVLQHVDGNDTTILASPSYSWIFSHVFHKQNVLVDYTAVLFQPITTHKVVLIADEHYMLVEIGKGKQFGQLYNGSKTVATFTNDKKYNLSSYPYTNLGVNYEENPIEVREK